MAIPAVVGAFDHTVPEIIISKHAHKNENGIPYASPVNLTHSSDLKTMQEIFHVHLHVFPRFRGDGFGLKFSPEYYTRRPERPQLEEMAAKLAPLMFRAPRRTPR